ncbi:MAG: ABC transporter permease [Synergistaceae bacterium]|jgi:peptide/nickel transport system permease protein|nr:ABC transporter permease [Synergistaceae bacterium]
MNAGINVKEGFGPPFSHPVRRFEGARSFFGALCSVTAYLGKKALTFLFMMFLLSTVVFYASRLTPGDPLEAFYGEATQLMTTEELDAARARLGLDGSITWQYVQWVSCALQGDFGMSLRHKRPVLEVVRPLIGNTLALGGTAYILAFLLAAPLALFCARFEDSLADRLICKAGTVAYCIPAFWLGTMLVLLFSVNLKWLPSSGAYGIGKSGDIGNRVRHMVLPLTVLVVSHLWYYTYMIRNKLLDEARRDYVLLARTKGLGRTRTLFAHCLRNVLPTIVNMMAIQCRQLKSIYHNHAILIKFTLKYCIYKNCFIA